MSAIDVKSEDENQVITPTAEPEVTGGGAAPEANTETPAPAEPVAPSGPSTPAAPVVSHHGNHHFGHIILETILGLAVVGLALWGWTVSADRNNIKQQLDAANANPQALVQKQSDELIAKVGTLMNLPKDETPTVANVSDAAAAKKQSPFFANAQNGDKVLMYVKTGEAVLYRPSTNKIILVAPLTFNNNTASAPATAGTSTTTKR
jgi:hypothetical protein